MRMHRHPITFLSMLLFLTACGTAPLAQTVDVTGRAATDLEASAGYAVASGDTATADVYAEAAEILRALPLGMLADENGMVPLAALQRSIVAAVGGNTEVGTAIGVALTKTLTEQGVPPGQIAWWVGGTALTMLVGRKLLPMLIAGASGTNVGGIVNTIVGLLWSNSTWKARKPS